MGITTCALISKDKPTSRAIITTAAMPKEQRSKQLSKSPRTAHINSLLAEITLPSNRFDNVLEALSSTSPTDAGLNNPCNLTPPTDKKTQVTQLASPTGVDEQEIGFHTPVDNASPQANEPPNTQTTPSSSSVRINETATLAGNNALMSICISLWRCIQGYLNFHLSSTLITLHGINTLDALEILWDPADKKTIAKFTLHNLLYRIKLVSKAPLFLQLSQRPTGEVDVVIPNTPKAETMAKRMNMQIAAWCHFYWKETNPGAKQFYRKLSDRAFNQVLCHVISACTWDPELKAVTSPRAQTEMAAIAEFEQQDWGQQLAQGSITQSTTRQQVNPNVAFLFQDDFSVGTIHGANIKAATPNINKVDKIQDNNDDMSNLTTKTAGDTQSEVVVGSQVASSSNPINGPTADSTQPGAACGGSEDLTSAGLAGRADGGRQANSCKQSPF